MRIEGLINRLKLLNKELRDCYPVPVSYIVAVDEAIKMLEKQTPINRFERTC
nr:MAG TPA: hypothetical protein [Caudoviricetes sp.]